MTKVFLLLVSYTWKSINSDVIMAHEHKYSSCCGDKILFCNFLVVVTSHQAYNSHYRNTFCHWMCYNSVILFTLLFTCIVLMMSTGTLRCSPRGFFLFSGSFFVLIRRISVDVPLIWNYFHLINQIINTDGGQKYKKRNTFVNKQQKEVEFTLTVAPGALSLKR